MGLKEMAMNENVDEFFENEEVMEFFAELSHTYLVCGVRDADGVKRLINNEGCVLDHLPSGPMAFAYLTLLNNCDLWEMRMMNRDNADHECHKKKGGLYTGSSARGGGDCKVFKSGWDDDGTRVHNKLVSFFSRMKKHARYSEVKTVCEEWWAHNKPSNKRPRLEGGSAEGNADSEPLFLEFTQMLGV